MKKCVVCWLGSQEVPEDGIRTLRAQDSRHGMRNLNSATRLTWPTQQEAGGWGREPREDVEGSKVQAPHLPGEAKRETSGFLQQGIWKKLLAGLSK